jgi:16S rRNA (adenine1518-N6/adenine1519-N6)-dimethyltransferase
MSESFEHKKSLGQHFLTSDYVPKKMCDAADVQAGETVLEIGPGTGVLTRELLLRGATVIAVEADVRAIESLDSEFGEAITAGQLIVHHVDARKLDLRALGLQDQTFKVVANIPYYLSGLLFRALLESTCQPTTLVFLVQKEVAARIARDKKESLLSLSVKVFGNPTYICTVSRGHFNPPPKIDSAVIAVRSISRNGFKTISHTDFFTILHLGFGQKRKQLLSNLSKQYARKDLEVIFNDLKLLLTIRAEDVSVTQWIDLVEKMTVKEVSTD